MLFIKSTISRFCCGVIGIIKQTTGRENHFTETLRAILIRMSPNLGRPYPNLDSKPFTIPLPITLYIKKESIQIHLRS